MPDNFSDEFKKEVAKQVREQAAKWTVAGVIALFSFAALGWLFAAKPYVDNYIKEASGSSDLATVPKAAVVAFDRPPLNECPEGWTRFKEATSRTIIGAGNSGDFYEEKFARDDQGRKLSSRAYRQHGGEEVHELSLEEMPEHDHKLRLFMQSGSGENNRLEPRPWSATVAGDTVHDEGVSAAGGKLAHNNMAPYIALYYCKKA